MAARQLEPCASLWHGMVVDQCTFTIYLHLCAVVLDWLIQLRSVEEHLARIVQIVPRLEICRSFLFF